MTALPSPGALHVQTAQEFLKKGNHAGARQALEQIGPEHLDQPDVLEIRWELAAHEGKWDSALDLATTLCQLAPENEFAWLWQACSLNELDRHQDAFDTLVSALPKFPQNPAIPYNLACCACRLGRLDDAWQWVSKTIEIGGRAEVKLMALDDPDLAPLLDRLCAL